MDGYVMVVAIDFGTTFSGYAFSFKKSPEDIKINNNWGSGVGFGAFKAPTCVLVNPQGNFQAFGFEAEDQYRKMVEDANTDISQWGFYKHFKMILYHKKELTHSSCISSTGGHITPAIQIFAMALRYLKDHVLELLSKQIPGSIDACHIRWVLTVPAIWSDKSKDFMREAAFQAGLMTPKDSKQLMIALEPEAASLFCRRLDLTQFQCDQSDISFTPGTKYLVIDAGGGTVDITAHEILSDSKIRELFAATGGAWGGSMVDEKFIELLKKVLGVHFVEEYQQQCPQQWVNLMVTFEQAKRLVSTGKKNCLLLSLSWSIVKKYREFSGKDIEATLMAANDFGVSCQNGFLIINESAVRAMFKAAIDGIIAHIQDLMGYVTLHPCKYFFLVGGFSGCVFLQEGIKDNFCGLVDILIPIEAQMSVVKGAVLFGHMPKEISHRIAAKTYGYRTTRTFNGNIHSQAKRHEYECGVRCNDIFEVLMEKEKEIPFCTKRSITLSPTNTMQTSGIIKFFSIDGQAREPVQYTDDIGVEQIASIIVDMSDTTGGLNRTVTLNVVFGGTEIEVEAIDETTKNTAKTSLIFMSYY